MKDSTHRSVILAASAVLLAACASSAGDGAGIEGRTRMTVVQVHPDSPSMEFHMEVAGSAFPKFAGLIELSTMDVYGEPSDGVLGRLRQKVQMLGSATVAVHDRHAGFARFQTH